MRDSDSVRAVTRRPTKLLAAAGWLATGLALASNDLVIAVATLGVGLLLWTLEARIAGLALTQVGAGIVAPTAPLAAIALLEIGPTLLVLALLAEHGRSIRTFLSGLAVLLGLSGTALAAFVWSESLAATTGVLVLVVASSSYAIHRYELVALGLVESEQT
jgi:hypothetical protein